MSEKPADYPELADIPQLGSALGKIRRRRWYLWCVLLVYLPTMWAAQRLAHSFEGALPVFCLWFLVLLLATGLSAAARCPRCGKYFHVNGMTLLYLRRCLHCQLHLSADQKLDHAERCVTGKKPER